MARFDEITDKDAINPNKYYIVGGGYSSKEEALSYARAIHASPKKIEVIGKGGYYVLQKGKDISMMTFITGSVREF